MLLKTIQYNTIVVFFFNEIKKNVESSAMWANGRISEWEKDFP